MSLHFEPVSSHNRNDLLRLQVLPEQKTFIETVPQCLAEASAQKNWRPVGLYDSSRPVGFAMYGYFFWEYFPKGRLWLDRLLIDRRHQGKGYGREALTGLLQRLAQEYPRKKIYLSVMPENGVAIRLYKQFGFRFTGEKDIHGEDVMVRT